MKSDRDFSYNRPHQEDSYGCEFIDDGNYGKPATSSVLEPWRERHDAQSLFELPLSFLLSLTDARYIAEIRKADKLWIENIKSSIASEGLRNPIVISYDSGGAVCISDGNHRLLAMQQIPTVDKIPVKLEKSSGRVSHGNLKLLSDVAGLLKMLSDGKMASFP